MSESSDEIRPLQPLYDEAFRSLPSKKLELRVEGGSIKLDRLRVHQLKSIWKQADRSPYVLHGACFRGPVGSKDNLQYLQRVLAA